jgi:hypothetical protein
MDSEDNHVLIRKGYAFNVILARYDERQIRRTHGRYRNQMRRHSKVLCK